MTRNVTLIPERRTDSSISRNAMMTYLEYIYFSVAMGTIGLGSTKLTRFAQNIPTIEERKKKIIFSHINKRLILLNGCLHF